MPHAHRSPTQGWARPLRVATLGGASILLASGAHLVGGGRLPSGGVLAVLTFLVGLASLVLTRRRVRFPVLLAALSVQQVLLHLAFDAAMRTGSACGSAMAAMSHATHALPACSTSTPMAAMSGSGWSMWAAHLAATAMTAVLLARGEAWLWRLGDAVVRAAAVRLGRRRPRSAPAALVTGSTQRAARPVLSRAAPRGPPLGLRAA